MITVPDYRGIYGTMQRYFDTEILGIHNLEIMPREALTALVPHGRLHRARVPLRTGLAVAADGGKALAGDGGDDGLPHRERAALLQPVDIPALCPMLVLKFKST